MTNSFYGNLAVSNIRKNSRGYIPYMLTCTVCVMIYYIMQAIALNPDVTKLMGGEVLRSMLNFGCDIVGFFSAIFLFYTNSYLIKQRKKELALYNILGMAKRHVGKMLFLESLLTSLVSMAAGLAGGVVLGKLCFLLLMKVLHVTLPMEYHFSGEAAGAALILFSIIFLAVLFCNLGRIRLSNPVELMSGGRQGEKEPKTKWILAVLGFVMTGIGYYLAITVEAPLEALMVFFVAVLLVIIGTYLLFIAGSIALLKILRRNKKFYYKTEHFTAVSGMLYRMKRNAAGLASICILSTMALVTISTTVSMQVGVQDVIDRNVVRDVQVISYEADVPEDNLALKAQVLATLQDHGVTTHSELDYSYVTASGFQKGSRLSPATSFSIDEPVVEMHFIPLKDSSLAEDYGPLAKNQVIVGGDNAIESDQLKIGDLTFNVKDGNSDFKGAPVLGSMNQSYYILVSDESVMDNIIQSVGKENFSRNYVVGANIGDGQQDQAAAAVEEIKAQTSSRIRANDRQTTASDFHSIYGGLLFVGIFLGLLFLMATVLIIYYKQITEGYEDSERYKIMQKVGMSLNEVKRSIRSQILIVFFLPLVAAVCHVAAAFNMMSKLLFALQIPNLMLFVMTTVITILIFVAIYVIVYGVTAREYYKLVR